jgi:hypothetical protein
MSFVNHQFQDLLSVKDPEARRRHAEAIRQLSPPNARERGIASPQGMTAYEQWWHQKKAEILQQLDGGSGGAAPSSPSSQARSVPRDAAGAAAASSSSSPARGGGACDKCAVEPSPVRGVATTAGTTTAASSSQPRSSPNRNIVPGTQYEQDHPSHLYLHHKGFTNHVLEPLVLHPENVEAQRSLRRELERSASRSGSRGASRAGSRGGGGADAAAASSSFGDGTGLTEYEKWWYGEQQRIAAYVEAQSHARSA